MAVTTSQQISRYYEQFQTADVTFTKEVIRALMLNTKQVFLKATGYQWPCIIYSSSMVGAKIIANLQTSLKEAFNKSKGLVSLRFSFHQRDRVDSLAFFVSAKIVGIAPYGDSAQGLHYLSLQYTQRPPDDLIERLGQVLEASIAAKRRREERIIMSPDVAKRLGLASKSAVVVVDHVPRKVLLRDISFGGAKVIMHGVPQFLVNKAALVQIDFEDPTETVGITGTIIRFEPVEGRPDIAAFAIRFSETGVPMAYKMRLSEYLRTVKQPAVRVASQDDSGAA